MVKRLSMNIQHFAIKNGMLSTYDVTENKVDVSPVLGMLSMPNTPFLNKIGISNEAVSAVKYEWWG